jgi:hypothetical protein
MKKIFKALLVLVVASFIVPQMALAAWWNPFSWKIFNVLKKPQTTIINTNQSIQKNSDSVIKPDVSNEELKKQEETKIKQEKELADTKKELQKTAIELQKLKENASAPVSTVTSPTIQKQNIIEPQKDSTLKIAQCQAKRDADYSGYASKVDQQIESSIQEYKDKVNGVLNQLKQSYSSCLSGASQYNQSVTPQDNLNLMKQESTYCDSAYLKTTQLQNTYTDQFTAKAKSTRDTLLLQGKAIVDSEYNKCINK